MKNKIEKKRKAYLQPEMSLCFSIFEVNLMTASFAGGHNGLGSGGDLGGFGGSGHNGLDSGGDLGGFDGSGHNGLGSGGDLGGFDGSGHNPLLPGE